MNEDQPRVPAGNPDGGQWTEGTQAVTSDVSGQTHRVAGPEWLHRQGATPAETQGIKEVRFGKVFDESQPNRAMADLGQGRIDFAPNPPKEVVMHEVGHNVLHHHPEVEGEARHLAVKHSSFFEGKVGQGHSHHEAYAEAFARIKTGGAIPAAVAEDYKRIIPKS
jgi:hypothetical protein